ncbi:hypothetical protein VTN02DRAFT_2152 [Thermoascus thermophilus]
MMNTERKAMDEPDGVETNGLEQADRAVWHDCEEPQANGETRCAVVFLSGRNGGVEDGDEGGEGSRAGRSAIFTPRI